MNDPARIEVVTDADVVCYFGHDPATPIHLAHPGGSALCGAELGEACNTNGILICRRCLRVYHLREAEALAD